MLHCALVLNGRKDAVQRCGRPHPFGCNLVVWLEVPANVHRGPLGSIQLINDGCFVGGRRLGNVSKDGSELGIVGLRRDSLGPEERDVVERATVVQLVDLLGWRLVLKQVFGGGYVQSDAQDPCPHVVVLVGDVVKGACKCQELTERVPPQRIAVIFFSLDNLGKFARLYSISFFKNQPTQPSPSQQPERAESP